MFDYEILKAALDTESGLLSADQMAGYAVTALCVIVNVAVAFFVIKRFVFKPLFKMIKNRQETLNKELAGHRGCQDQGFWHYRRST